MGIIGRNGAGKSTLLKILSRITEPTAGRVELKGRVASLLEVGTGFHPELTGRENVFLNGAILGMSRAEIRKKFDEIVDFAEVEKFLDTPVKRYSSGMYVRLAFAVAAHLEPEILIVDEVLAVGDVEFQKKCLGKMEQVSKGGRTVLFVSHELNAVQRLTQHCLLLHRGELIDQGKSEGVCERYTRLASKMFTHGEPVERPESQRVGKDYWIQCVEVTDMENKPRLSFRYGEQLRIHLTIEGRIPNSGYGVGWIIKKYGAAVTYSHSTTTQGVSYSNGQRRVCCEVGPLNLTTGQYEVTIGLRKMRHEVHADLWESATSFEINQCDPFGTGFDVNIAAFGTVVIPHRWLTEN